MKNLINLIFLLTTFSLFSQEQIDTLDGSIVSIPQIVYLKSDNHINIKNLENDTVSISIFNRWGKLISPSYDKIILTEDDFDLEIVINDDLTEIETYIFLIQINNQSTKGYLITFNNFKREIEIVNNLVLSNEQLNIEIKGYKNDTLDIAILNIQGQIISSDSNLVITEDSTNHYIDTYTFPAGVYILAIDSQYIKFVIESGPVSIKNKSSNLLTLSPNLASDFLFINTDYEILSTKIYNLNGELIYQSANEKSIAVNNLSKGIYTVKIISDHQIFTEHLLIN